MYKIELHNTIDSLQGYIEGCYQQPSMQSEHLSGTGAIFLLEKKLRKYYSKKYAVTFCNATTALHTLCLALNLGKTEILTSPFNWGGAISPFLLHRSNLRFTAFDPVTLNILPEDLPSAITHKTKAVLSVDYNGNPVDSEAVKSFCSQNDLVYISDCSQSFGSFYKNIQAGYYADAIVLSFGPGKSIYAGEGGAVLTDNDAIYEKLLWFSQHPSRQKPVFGLSNYNGYAPINGRMNPFSAIVLYELFETALESLKQHQMKCYNLLSRLREENLIDPAHHIKTPDSSTFSNFSLQLNSLVNTEEINHFLQKMGFPFIAIDTIPKLIPYNDIFKRQFRGRYSCSEYLTSQKKTVQLNNRVKMNILQSKTAK